MKCQRPNPFVILTIHGDAPTRIVLGQCTAREVPVDLEEWLERKGYQFTARKGYISRLYDEENSVRFNALMEEYRADWRAKQGVILQ